MTAGSAIWRTAPRDIVLSGGVVPYKGTAVLNQLEVPYVVELTGASQTSFFLELTEDAGFTIMLHYRLKKAISALVWYPKM